MFRAGDVYRERFAINRACWEGVVQWIRSNFGSRWHWALLVAKSLLVRVVGGGIVVYECFLLLGMATIFLSTPIREMKVTRLVDKCGGSMAVYLLHPMVIYFLRIPFDINSIDGQLLRYVLTLGGNFDAWVFPSSISP